MSVATITAFKCFSIKYEQDRLFVIDQRLLPDEEQWLESKAPEDMVVYIKQLSVRGAPLIGVAAAMALADYARKGHTEIDIIKAATHLRTARPTAVNLMHCIDAMVAPVDGKQDLSPKRLCETAYRLMKDEIDMCDKMSSFGAALIKSGENILTHCNTGALATPGKGTALGVIREAHAQGKNIHVYVDETRPLLQGARLTTYELMKEGIPYTLISDNMAAVMMRQGKIQRVLVGADRISLNGDFANKIGTYSVAALAKFHNIPFHTVAPVSTIDFKCPNGDHIPIEQRDGEEVKGVSGSFGSVRWAPKSSPTVNPAFDVTPGELLESIILDVGVFDRSQIAAGALTKLSQK